LIILLRLSLLFSNSFISSTLSFTFSLGFIESIDRFLFFLLENVDLLFAGLCLGKIGVNDLVCQAPFVVGVVWIVEVGVWVLAVQDAHDTLKGLVRNLLELVVLDNCVRLRSPLSLVFLIWQFYWAVGLLIDVFN